MNQRIYSFQDVDKFVSDMIEKGYELIQLRDGVLGIGDSVLISPDAEHYNFVIREIHLNEWSSGHTIRRASKISRKLQAEIDATCTE